MRINRKQLQRIGLHILFWTVILFWRSNGDYFSKIPFERFVYRNLLRLPLIIISTYAVIYYLIPKFVLNLRKYFQFGVLLFCLLFAATMLDKLLTVSPLMEMVLQSESEKEYQWMTQLHPYRNSFLLMSIIGIASLIHFFKVYTQQEKRKNELIQENLETKYAFLKSQVNPHFLFNALNNIYSMAVQENQNQIAHGVKNLSGIMRYLTYESNSKKVPLEKEINLLQDYMAIEQLRFDKTDDITISFSVEGDISQKAIAPVVLLPLIENAFKHGIKPDQTCLISIKFILDNDVLKCLIKNTVFDFENREISSHGIGLENVRKRLNMQYENQYTLISKKEGAYYLTDLQINLKEQSQRNDT